MTTKKITLNAEKRKVIADQFQSFYENKVKDKLVQAKEQYDLMRLKAKEIIEQVVRQHQPQEDIDTIREMTNKYGRSGGELYEDNCFYIRRPTTEIDSDGNEYEDNKEIHIRFDMGKKFARAYYRDALKIQGLNPDFHVAIDDDQLGVVADAPPGLHDLGVDLDQPLLVRPEDGVQSPHAHDSFHLRLRLGHEQLFAFEEDVLAVTPVLGVPKVFRAERVDEPAVPLRLAVHAVRIFLRAQHVGLAAAPTRHEIAVRTRHGLPGRFAKIFATHPAHRIHLR